MFKLDPRLSGLLFQSFLRRGEGLFKSEGPLVTVCSAFIRFQTHTLVAYMSGLEVNYLVHLQSFASKIFLY